MTRLRSAVSLVTLGLLASACEAPDETPSVAFAGLRLPGAAVPDSSTWQSTLTRRVRWGPGIDVMVAPFPDGERMAVTDWSSGDVAVYELGTGAMTRLTEQSPPFAEGVAMFPVVSPDGGRIAYSWQDYREDLLEIQLRVVGTDGADPARLYRGPPAGWINATDWSRDGSRVLVVRMREDGANEIASVATADGAPTVVKTLGPRYPTQVRFSPDGRFIAYDYPTTPESDDRDVYVLAADGSSETTLIQGPANDRLLGWSPNGGSVLFLSDRGGTPGAWVVPVSDGRAAGEAYLVKPDMWNTEAIGFDARGRYFYGVGVGARALYEVTFSPDGRSIAGEPKDLTSRAHQEVQHPRWSPDGRYVAFDAVRQGRPPALMIRSVESGEEREISMDRRIRYFYDLEWMPDGRSLVAVVTDEQQVWPHQPLLSIDVRTGETTVLIQPAGPEELISGVTVSPDGRTLFYTKRVFAETPADGAEQIIAYEVETGAQRTIYDGDPTRRIRSLVISPDGRTLAFDHGTVGQDTHIVVMPLETGRPRNLAEGLATSIAWTPDSRALLVIYPVESAGRVNPPTRLYRLDVATGETIYLGLERRSMGVASGLAFHPGGRRVLLTAGAPEMEWWVMEGFLAPRESPGAEGDG